MSARPLVFYVTAHGYGHAARTCDILRSLLRRHPRIPIVVVSELDRAFFASRLGDGAFRWRPGRFDVGLVQLDSVRADIDATLLEWQCLLHGYDDMIREEAGFLREFRAAAVGADIPALPFEAAAEAGLPSVAVGNFGWDWIYSAYQSRDPAWSDVVEVIHRGYRQADLLLRTPFSDTMSTFARQQPIGLAAAPGRPRREEIARRTGADPGIRWALLSFSTLDWDEFALEQVKAIADHELFTMLPLQWDEGGIHAIDRDAFPFADLLASCDVVISKPGYGILSECVVNEKPLIYVDRTDFLEYDVLLDGLRRTLRHVHLPAPRLYRGELAPALAAIQDAPPPPERVPGGGAEDAADALAAAWERGHSPGSASGSVST